MRVIAASVVGVVAVVLLLRAPWPWILLPVACALLLYARRVAPEEGERPESGAIDLVAACVLALTAPVPALLLMCTVALAGGLDSFRAIVPPPERPRRSDGD